MSVELGPRIIFALCALTLLAAILQLIRHGHLKEKYALLWLPLGFAFGLFSIFPDLLVLAAAKVHLHYITVVMLCVILGFTLILLYFTVRMSKMREDIKILAQELAMTRVRSNPRTLPQTAEAPESSGWVARPAEKSASTKPGSR